MMLTYFFAKGIIITKSSDAQKAVSGVPYQARAEVGVKAAVYPTRRELKWERKQRCTLPYSGSENSEGLSVALSPLLFKEAFN